MILKGLVLRTGDGILRPVWARAFGALIRGVVAYLLRGISGTAYVKGGFATGPVYGFSDIDLIIIGQPRIAVARWRRLCRIAPFVDDAFDFSAGTEPEFARAESTDCLTYGLHDAQKEDPVFAPRSSGQDHFLRLALVIF